MNQSSLERCERAVRFERPDRVPVIPLIIQHAVKLAGVPQNIYSTRPDVLAETQISCLRRYGYDGIHVTSDNWILPESLGRKIQLQANGPPLAGPPPLAQRSDFNRLKLPKPERDGRMPLLIEATRIAVGDIGKTHYIKTNFDQGPFSLATALRGIQEFMLDLYDDTAFATNLLSFCTEVVTAFGIAVANAGAHAVTFGDSTAGLLSRDLYEEFAYPYEKYVIESIRDKTGVPVFLHICGNTEHIVDKMAQTGADALELDSRVDLAVAKKKIGRRICIEGNVEPSEILLRGQPQDVMDASMDCLRNAADDPDGGFILSSGCEVPPDTPPANIQAMVDAVARWGGKS